MSKIYLHPEKGVNPRLGCCARCGKVVNGLVLMGTREFVDTCDECGMRHYGGAEKGTYGNRECQNKKCRSSSFTRRTLDDHEKIPMDLCDDCKKERTEHQEFMAQAHAAAKESNAVLVKHEKCGSTFVIRGDHPLAIAARSKCPDKDHQLVGVDLEDVDELCPNCRKNAAEKESEA